MSPQGRPIEGKLSVRLSCADRRVTGVHISSSRTALPKTLVQARPARDVQRLVPLLFSVCARAHGAASHAAIDAACSTPVDPADRADEVRAVIVEAVQETVWRLLIDWPRAMGEPAIVGPVARVRQAASAMTDAGVALDALLAIVDAVVDEHLYGIPPGEWLATMSLVAFDQWVARGGTLAARLLRRLADESPGLGTSDVALMPDATLESLNRALLGELELDPANCASLPLWAGRPAETGALARQSATPLVSALRARDGHTAATRFVARLVELATLLSQLRQHAAAEPAAVRSHAVRDGVGIGLAETARGLLLHRVRVDGDRVADYCIVAPTEWNFHPDGPLQALRGHKATDAARLERDAGTVVQSLDPCVECHVEIADA
jgi:uptake hydrogenase large subunit